MIKLILAPLLITMATDACAQFAAIGGPVPDDINSIGGGVSVGTNLDKDADFWGLTIDYGTGLANGWSLSISLAYDKETEQRSGKPDKVTQTYSPTFVWAKPMGERWSLFAGFAKGVMDDSKQEGSFEWTKLDEDWGVGAGGSYLIYRSGKHAWSVSGALEYKINDAEFAVSTDIGYAYFF